MYAHFDLTFDADPGQVQVVCAGIGLIGQPVGRPTGEVGGEDDQAFLQKDGEVGAHLDTMEVENMFAFLRFPPQRSVCDCSA